MKKDELLNLMMNDSKKYKNTVYGLTPYWEFYNKSFIQHVHRHGLNPDKPHRVYSSLSAFMNPENENRYNRCISYVEQYVDFNNIKLVVDLGCGGGNQMILLKKKYPHLTVWLFDIPPFLYTTEFNIDSKFKKKDYVSYKLTRDIKPDTLKCDGRFFIFANWMFPIVLYHKVDLFWNSASFQEMEKDVVGNYLSYVNHSADFIFLYECMDNSYEWGVKYLSHNNEGRGVSDRVWLDDYKKGLKDIDLLDIQMDKHNFPYCLSMWKKNK